MINDGDQVAIGATSRPNLIYGLGASASWKGLDVNVHFQGAGKSTFFTYGKCVWAFTESITSSPTGRTSPADGDR